MKITFSRRVREISSYSKELRRAAEDLVGLYKMDSEMDSMAVSYNDREHNDEQRFFVLCIDKQEEGIKLW